MVFHRVLVDPVSLPCGFTSCISHFEDLLQNVTEEDFEIWPVWNTLKYTLPMYDVCKNETKGD